MTRVIHTWPFALVLGALLPAILADPAAAQGRAALVKDINLAASDHGGPEHLTAVDDLLYFVQSDGEHGAELWRTDGSTAGTAMVADVHPGPRGSQPRSLIGLGGLVFFVADDAVHGAELWVSDGTSGGTALVADINPGPAGSSPDFLTEAGGELLFAADDGSSGVELWATDGTPEGTRRVADVQPGPGSSRPRNLIAWRGALFFTADDGTHGEELWTSDGSDDGTALVHDLRMGPDGSGPFGLLPHPATDALFFGAFTDDAGWALWRSDGNAATLVADVDVDLGAADARAQPLLALGDAVLFRVHALPQGSQVWRTKGVPGDAEPVTDFTANHAVWPQRAVAMGGNAYFVGHDPVGGGVLLRSDGSAAGTTILADLNRYPCSNEFMDPVVLGERLFFAARQPGDRGELWTSDGTPGGTHRVKDIFPGSQGSRPMSLTALGDTLFFRASDGLHGRELWRSDGSEEGTVLVADVFPGTRDAIMRGATLPMAYDDHVYFGSIGTGAPSAEGSGLWRSDGTAAGTAPLPGTQGMSVAGWLLRPATSRLYFWASLPALGSELWRTDGTPNGAQLVADIAPGAQGSAPQREAVVAGDGIFFAANTAAFGAEPWFSDGTEAGTHLLADIRPGPQGSAPSDMVVAAGRAFFTAFDPVHGRELWTSDGTAAGTHLVADIRPGAASGIVSDIVSYLTPFGSEVYFVANDGTHGLELWGSDGTAAGTRLVRDIRPGPQGGMPVNLHPVAFGNILLFAADDGSSGTELWRSDGTAAGTRRVKDVWPGPVGGGASGLTVTDRYAYFAAGQASSGWELWRSDGTETGTVLVKDIHPGPWSSSPNGFVALRDHVYFRAQTPDAGEELWVSDGTETGTRLVSDIHPGPAGSSLHSAVNVAGRLFFAADDGVHGAELWALSCGDGIVDPSEACDDGAQNGSAASCCSAVCTWWSQDLDDDGLVDCLDPEDATLEPSRAHVRGGGPSPAATAVVTVAGYFTIDPARGDSFDAVLGMAVTVADGATLAAAAVWDADACTTTRRGVIRCRDGAHATARFRPAGTDEGGRPRYFFRVRLVRLPVAGPFVAPLRVTVTHGAAIDRVGALDGCAASTNTLRCKR